MTFLKVFAVLVLSAASGNLFCMDIQEQLIVRPVRGSDYAFLHSLLTHPTVAEFCYGPHLSPKVVQEKVNTLSNNLKLWMVCNVPEFALEYVNIYSYDLVYLDNDERTPAGQGIVTNVTRQFDESDQSKKMQLDVILEPTLWDQGYEGSVIQAMINRIRNNEFGHCEKIVMGANVHDERKIRFIKEAGFELLGSKIIPGGKFIEGTFEAVYCQLTL